MSLATFILLSRIPPVRGNKRAKWKFIFIMHGYRKMGEPNRRHEEAKWLGKGGDRINGGMLKRDGVNEYTLEADGVKMVDEKADGLFTLMGIQVMCQWLDTCMGRLLFFVMNFGGQCSPGVWAEGVIRGKETIRRMRDLSFKGIILKSRG